MFSYRTVSCDHNESDLTRDHLHVTGRVFLHLFMFFISSSPCFDAPAPPVLILPLFQKIGYTEYLRFGQTEAEAIFGSVCLPKRARLFELQKRQERQENKDNFAAN